MDRAERIKEVGDFWGKEKMPMLCMEELAELAQAISKFERNPCYITMQNVVTEMADVQIACGAYAYLHGISSDTIDYRIDQKLNIKYEEKK